MSTELTEAEQAVAQALAAHHNAHSTTDRLGVGAFAAEARAVLAAVRPIIEAGALREFAETLDTLPAAYGSDPEYRSGIADAVGIARARANRRDNP